MGAVIDIKTRQQRAEPPKPQSIADAENNEAFAAICEDSLWVTALKINAVNGLDRALKSLHRVADKLRNAGNPNYRPME